MIERYKWFYTVICIMLMQHLLAQVPTIEISTDFDSLSLRPYTMLFVDSTQSMNLQQVENQVFRRLDQMDLLLSNECGRYYYWFKFEVANTHPIDSLKLSFSWLYNGFEWFELFGKMQNQWTDSVHMCRIVRPHPQAEKQLYFPYYKTALFKLAPKSQKSIYIRLYANHQSSLFRPVLFNAKTEGNLHYNHLIKAIAINISFLAILGFALAYTLINFIQYRHRAFLYYAAYVVSQFFFYWFQFVWNYPFTNLHFPKFLLQERYWIPISHNWILFYLLFTVQFLDAKIQMPHLYKWSTYFFYLCLTAILSDRITTFFDLELALKMLVIPRQLFNILGLLLTFYILYQLRDHSLGRYIAGGSLIYAIGAFFNRFVTPYSSNPFLDNGLVFNQFGIIGELLCFSAGLAHKASSDAIQKNNYLLENQRLEVERHRLEVEKQQIILNLRQQIMQDFHDDFGIAYTTVANKATLATQNQDTLALQNALITTACAVRQLYQDTRHSVETILPKYKHFDEMQAQFRSFASEFWTSYPAIDVVFDFPEPPESTELSPHVIYELSRIFKEAQLNTAKYAEASQVQLTLKVLETNRYWLEIRDNGNGFQPQDVKIAPNRPKSLGLSGMQHRVNKINALLKIETKLGTGTAIQVQGALQTEYCLN
jgi:signal transduction histidine kinase